MSSGRWVRRFGEHGTSSRLLCLPHAGGTAAAFRALRDVLPAGVELAVAQYPGRQDRIDEPFAESIEEMAAGVDATLDDLDDRPTVVLGHSMGAAVAYELAHRRAGAGRPPVLVVMSARGAPHRVHGEHRHRLSDPALVRDMTRLGGPGAEAFAHEALRPVVLPPLRADLRCLDAYRPSAPRRLACPVLPVRGRGDERCGRVAMETWREVADVVHPVLELPGGHHYFLDDATALDALAAPVRTALAGPGADRPPPVPLHEVHR